MAFVTDSFTYVSGSTLLENHVGELGATWTRHTAASSAGTSLTLNAPGRIYAGSGSGLAAYFTSAVPATADYDVEVDVFAFGSVQSSYGGPVGRLDPTVATYYGARWAPAPTSRWQLYKGVAGVVTSLGTSAVNPAGPTARRVILKMLGTSIKVNVDGVDVISVTDSAVTGVGRAGVWTTGAATSNGTHLDNLSAVAIVAGPPLYPEPTTPNPARLFLPNCYVNRLDRSKGIDPATPAVVAELRKFTDIKKTGINIDKWTTQIHVLPADQPLVPVRLTAPPTWSPSLAQVLATGVPIPPGWTPTDDTDAHFAAYQPDWESPDGRFKGRYWELYATAKEAPGTGFEWSAAWGGRMCNVAQNRGHFEEYPTWGMPASGYKVGTPGDPNSTYEENRWGGTATSIPLIAGMVLKEDVARGRITHVIGLAPSETAPWPPRYPAQRTDGGWGPIEEGMILALPADHVPESVHPFVRLLEQGVRDHGFVVWDKGTGYVTLRGEPGLDIGTVAPWDQLATFPWAKLQVLV